MPLIENCAGFGRKALLLAAAVALPASALTFSTPAGAQHPVVLAVVDVKVVALGFRISELIGKPVYKPLGQKIGKVDDFIIQRGKVLMTIINVGGRLIAIPYSSLQMTPKGMVLPGASKQAVGKLPQFHYRR